MNISYTHEWYNIWTPSIREKVSLLIMSAENIIPYFILSAFIVSLYKLYYILKCPKEIEHIPAAPFFTFFLFHLDRSNHHRVKMSKYFQPLFNEHGVIRVSEFILYIKLILTFSRCSLT
jgi:hypothetical protein